MLTSDIDRSPLPLPDHKPHPPKAQDLKQFEVICRVRPLQESEATSDLTVGESPATVTIFAQNKNSFKEFAFNKIYHQTTSQGQFTRELSEEIFNNCRINGRGSLVLSYGVTNSGKTYTILGTEEEPGLLPTIVSKIEQEYPFEEIKITAIEAYNDEFYSLKDKQRLFPKEAWGTYEFEDYEPEKITKESTKDMMKQYMQNRNQTDTRANKKSSRSHAIFKIECEELSMAIVDLAGSERIKKTNSCLQETTSINTSLLVLGKCIHAFRDGAIIPFRESKLTRALTEYFTPRYKIYMIAHINRSGEMFHENLKVLEYAALSTQVKQFNPNVNKSIAKSARKRNAKSAVKFNMEDDGHLSKSGISIKSAISKKNKEKGEVIAEVIQLEKVVEKEGRNRRRTLMQKYINQMVGRMKEFDYYLDREFEKEDEIDRNFINNLSAEVYQSPVKRLSAAIQIKKAESRIRFRKQILDELQKEKKQKMVDNETYMGPSMKKCLQQSLRKKLQQQGQQQSEAQPEEEKQKQQNEEQYQHQEPEQQRQQEKHEEKIKISLNSDEISLPNNEDKEENESARQFSINTPKKVIDAALQTVKSIMHNSCKSFKVLCQSLQKSVHQMKDGSSKRKDIRRLARVKLSLKIEPQFHYDIISELYPMMHSQVPNSQSYPGTQNSQQETVLPESKEYIDRGVGSSGIKHYEDESRETTIQNILHEMEPKFSHRQNSQTCSQDIKHHQLDFMRIQPIPERRQSEEMQTKNSPFFKMSQPSSTKAANKQPKQMSENKPNIQNAYAPELKMNDSMLKNTQDTSIQGSTLKNSRMDDSRDKDARSFSKREPIKSRYHRKPMRQQGRQMQFVMSPLQTRSQRQQAGMVGKRK